MSLLQNLTAIRIRGTYNRNGIGYLMNFKLETAKEGREKGSSPATWVEKCTCSEAYVGDYCEECASGFRHFPSNGGPYSRCIPCECHGHARICDTTTGTLPVLFIVNNITDPNISFILGLLHMFFGDLYLEVGTEPYYLVSAVSMSCHRALSPEP